ncbi:MAG: hypothetical protein R2699_13035 [Acidimicrobiales bacterium]
MCGTFAAWTSAPPMSCALGQLVEHDVAREIGHADREVRGPHELVEGVGQREAVVLGRSVDVEPGTGHVDRHEERQALHVVPVQVGDEGVPSERTVRRLLVAEEPQTGADVEDQGIDAGRVDAHARGVAAVATIRLT